MHHAASTNSIILTSLLAAVMNTPLSATPLPTTTLVALEKARAGGTITLPAGTFEAGDLAVPAGVTLKGMGRGRTVLDAKGKRDGVILGDRAQVSDLTVLNAMENGIVVRESKGAVVARVVVRGCQSGVLMRKATDARIENAVLADNRTGLAMIEAEGCVAANLTLAGNTAIGLTLSHCRGARVFNNLVVGSQIGTRLDANIDLALDHLQPCVYAG